MKYVRKIGVELEGGWDENPPVGRPVPDESIQLKGAPVIGEVQSPPGVLEEIEEFVIANCPEYIDTSCGLHIHVSLNSTSQYLALTDVQFHNFVKERTRRWADSKNYKPTHRIFKRLNGENKHCKDVFNPEDQIKCTTKEQARQNEVRRTHLNYCYNIQNDDGTPRRTIENRIFPAFNNPEEIMEAVRLYVECVEEYLDHHSLEESAYPTINLKLSELKEEIF